MSSLYSIDACCTHWHGDSIKLITNHSWRTGTTALLIEQPRCSWCCLIHRWHCPAITAHPRGLLQRWQCVNVVDCALHTKKTSPGRALILRHDLVAREKGRWKDVSGSDLTTAREQADNRSMQTFGVGIRKGRPTVRMTEVTSASSHHLVTNGQKQKPRRRFISAIRPRSPRIRSSALRSPRSRPTTILRCRRRSGGCGR